MTRDRGFLTEHQAGRVSRERTRSFNDKVPVWVRIESVAIMHDTERGTQDPTPAFLKCDPTWGLEDHRKAGILHLVLLGVIRRIPEMLSGGDDCV